MRKELVERGKLYLTVPALSAAALAPGGTCGVPAPAASDAGSLPSCPPSPRATAATARPASPIAPAPSTPAPRAVPEAPAGGHVAIASSAGSEDDGTADLLLQLQAAVGVASDAPTSSTEAKNPLGQLQEEGYATVQSDPIWGAGTMPATSGNPTSSPNDAAASIDDAAASIDDAVSIDDPAAAGIDVAAAASIDATASIEPAATNDVPTIAAAPPIAVPAGRDTAGVTVGDRTAGGEGLAFQ
eukprot:GHVT01072447.1.p1 GENE.GHVT01072447.1~~GHVT01072447.1.p1  ORF type:complete len:243 (+),score=70.90 GHVT01072447.1:169-897(+)